MVIWTLIHLVTSTASCNILATENDFPNNYWIEQLIVIFKITWKCLKLRLFPDKFPNYKFSMVNEPIQIIFGYPNNWGTNNLYKYLLYLIWSTTHGERAHQILINNNYSPIGAATGTEMSWALISWIFPNWQHSE